MRGEIFWGPPPPPPGPSPLALPVSTFQDAVRHVPRYRRGLSHGRTQRFGPRHPTRGGDPAVRLRGRPPAADDAVRSGFFLPGHLPHPLSLRSFPGDHRVVPDHGADGPEGWRYPVRTEGGAADPDGRAQRGG